MASKSKSYHSIICKKQNPSYFNSLQPYSRHSEQLESTSNIFELRSSWSGFGTKIDKRDKLMTAMTTIATMNLPEQKLQIFKSILFDIFFE